VERRSREAEVLKPDQSDSGRNGLPEISRRRLLAAGAISSGAVFAPARVAWAQSGSGVSLGTPLIQMGLELIVAPGIGVVEDLDNLRLLGLDLSGLQATEDIANTSLVDEVTDGGECTADPDFDFTDCCGVHDDGYTVGGGDAERLACDQALRARIKAKGHPKRAPRYYWRH